MLVMTQNPMHKNIISNPTQHFGQISHQQQPTAVVLGGSPVQSASVSNIASNVAATTIVSSSMTPTQSTSSSLIKSLLANKVTPSVGDSNASAASTASPTTTSLIATNVNVRQVTPVFVFLLIQITIIIREWRLDFKFKNDFESTIFVERVAGAD